MNKGIIKRLINEGFYTEETIPRLVNKTFAYQFLNIIPNVEFLHSLCDLKGKTIDFEDIDNEIIKKIAEGFDERKYTIGTREKYGSLLRIMFSSNNVKAENMRLLHFSRQKEYFKGTLLSKEDLKLIDDLPPFGHAYDAYVSVWMLMCFTGASYEEVMEFTVDNITADGKGLFYCSKKQHKDINIPMTNVIRRYLSTDRSEIKNIIASTMFRALKKICVKAGINKGKVKNLNRIMAKRIFCTQMYRSGYKDTEILDMVDDCQLFTVRYNIDGYSEIVQKRKQHILDL